MTLIKQAEQFIKELFKDKLSPEYTFHNFNHTLSVVKGVKELCKHEKIDKLDQEIIIIAAWFHDAGYINGAFNHEKLSVIIVSEFLKEREKSEEYISKVSDLIMATTFDNIPDTIFEKIIKDADYMHLTSESFESTSDLLRKERGNTEQKEYTDLEWEISNLRFLTKLHSFYTDHAQSNWKKLKEKNIDLLQDRIKKIKNKMDKPAESEKEIKKDLKKKLKKKLKDNKPDKGIDTLFRVTLNNHTRLSGIADSKANILLSVNAIIISIALSSIIPKLDSLTNRHLVIPTFIMLIFCVVCIIFAILSTRPKVTTGTFTREDIVDQKVNLLFFGNFYKMPLEEYEWAVNEMMNDKTYLYNTLIKDLYFLGIVLEKKYRLLRITYNIFMVGIIISAIAFVFAFNFNGV
jgi:predicted metal-dependent HD superfamily phosphohydrolase